MFDYRLTVLSNIYETDEKANRFYTHLHLALLESLIECMPVILKRPQHIISAQQLAAIVPQILDSHLFESDERLQNAIDRLGQAVQLALHTKSVYGNKRKLNYFLVYRFSCY